MSDNQNIDNLNTEIQNTEAIGDAQGSDGHKKHHHHHHHHSHDKATHSPSSHGHHRHHRHHSSDERTKTSGSHKHHTSRHSTSKKKSNSLKRLARKIKSFFKRISKKLTLHPYTTGKKIKKLALSTKGESRKEYVKISSRVLFGFIIVAIFSTAIYFIFTEEEDTSLKTANYTPSETTILKIQVMQLEQENAQLTQQLEKYKALYGELEEENSTEAPATNETQNSGNDSVSEVENDEASDSKPQQN